MRTLSSVPLLAALSCAACASTPSDPPGSPDTAPPGSECRAEPAQQYVGRKAETQVVEAAKAASQARQVRVIGPEDAVTADFRPDRLNIRVDAGRAIIEIACG
jgi:hypothetical protein